MRGVRYGRRTVCWLLLGGLAAMCTGAREADAAYVYRISVEGRPVGYHRFQLRRKKDSIRVTSQTRLDGEVWWQAKEISELDAETYRTRRYQLQQWDGWIRSDIEVVFGERMGVVTHHIRSSQWTEDVSYREVPWLLDNHLIDHYALLAQHLGPLVTDGLEIKAFVPQSGRLITAWLRRATWKEAKEGWTLIAQVPGQGTVLMAINPESHHLLKMAIPDRSYRAELTGEPMPAISLRQLPSALPVHLTHLPTAFRSEQVRFAAADGTILAGTLAAPSDHPLAPLPAVLLLQGSGPQDRDARMGPNRPFAELASHLASAGYAVFRYDKRGVAQSGGTPAQQDRQTLLADARTALDFLRGRQEIAAHRIFILGHSEGGELAPALAIQQPLVAGLILMGAPATPIDRIILHELSYLMQSRGDEPADIDTAIQELRTDLARIRAGNTQGPLLWKMPRSWWQQTLAVDFVGQIAQVRCPLLILQGEKDFRVLPEDAERLAAAARASGNRDIALQRFPGLNHRFRYVDGASTGEEDAIPGQLSPQVVNAILEWLKRR